MVRKEKLGFLLLGMLLFMMLFCGCEKQKEPEPVFHRTPVSQKQEEDEKELEETQDTEYVIEELNMEDETITVRALNSPREVRYRYTLGTSFLDKYGEHCSSLHFTAGQVVKITETSEGGSLAKVQMSDEVWKNETVSNYEIDATKGIFTIGQSKYRITENTKFFSGFENASVGDIGKDDLLQVIGKDKTIVSVMIMTGHGYLELKNTDLFKDSMICIGDKIFTTITGDMTIEVPEGAYDITVANNGYGGTKNYKVTRNETTTVDLNKLKGKGPKKCKLSFETAVKGAKVYVDGKEVKVGKVHKVTYGAHTLQVVAEGYETWEKTLIVNSPEATIVLDLTDENSNTNQSNSSANTNNTTTNGNTTNQSSDTSSSNTSSGSTDTNTSNSGSDSKSDSSSSNGSKTDAEVDYLTTLSNMLTNILD